MSKRIAIIQSCYIPWKGYFDLINAVDEFVLFDDVQFTRRDWRNRNRIKTPAGTAWLTVPVAVKGRYLQTIRETRVSDPQWAGRHWRSIQASYARAPYYAMFKDVIEDLYRGCTTEWLSEVNFRFIARFCEMLGIRTRLSWSMDYTLGEGRTERLVTLCRQAGATEYLSGPAARAYIEPQCFADAGIALSYMDYEGYPEYEQLYPPFDHHVSLIDLFVHTGPDAAAYLRSAPDRTARVAD